MWSAAVDEDGCELHLSGEPTGTPAYRVSKDTIDGKPVLLIVTDGPVHVKSSRCQSLAYVEPPADR